MAAIPPEAAVKVRSSPEQNVSFGAEEEIDATGGDSTLTSIIEEVSKQAVAAALS